MSDKRKNIVVRFGLVYAFIVFLFLLIIYKMFVIQNIEGAKWLALAAKNQKTDIVVRPNRGNIYSWDSRLLASSIPTYYIYMDLRVPALHQDTGKLFLNNVDSVALCLSRFFNDKSKAEYKSMLMKGYRSGDAELQIYPEKISYAQLKEIKTFPLFRLGRNKSGLITKEMFRRVKPFGSLASRTIGDIYADETKGGKNGLELQFDSVLRGIPGLSTRQKVANSLQETVEVEPIDGRDVITTIDVDMQDIAERALLDGLVEFDAAIGYAVLMEANSGEVKAIVNMQRNGDGTYSENKNGGVSDMAEPGSTFKVVSLMAVLDDGKAKLSDSVETFNGHFKFGNRIMNDHNAERGGFGRITLAQAIYYSSNIGVSRIIEKAYGRNPSAFVDKLYEMKLNEPMNIEIPGAAKIRIRHPNDKSQYWSATTLPWMSIGYETQVPPIYTLAFYNSIANGGKLIRPYFVKAISRNGQIERSFTTEVINPAICKPSTLQEVRSCLLGVVEDKRGTGKTVKSDFVRIAGKSGTAQISQGKAGYKSGGTKHQVSFCGFFPYENPKYTLLVIMREPGKGSASGGHMSGSVFKRIAEEVMALHSSTHVSEYKGDSTLNVLKLPYCKNGFASDLSTVMNGLNIKVDAHDYRWIKTLTGDNSIAVEKMSNTRYKVPDMTGMGAKDAVYLAQSNGLTVRIQGRGKVITQNLKPGSTFKKGDILSLVLE